MRNKKAAEHCQKVCYYTKKDARTALNNFGKDRGSVRFYECPYHDGRKVFHLTSEAR